MNWVLLVFLFGMLMLISPSTRDLGLLAVAISLTVFALAFLGGLVGQLKESRRKAEESRLREQLRTEYGVWSPSDAYEEVRQKVLKRDHHRCRDCGDSDGVEVHHITRRSEGGTNEPGNLITLCRMCHESKHPGARAYYTRKFYERSRSPRIEEPRRPRR